MINTERERERGLHIHWHHDARSGPPEALDRVHRAQPLQRLRIWLVGHPVEPKGPRRLQRLLVRWVVVRRGVFMGGGGVVRRLIDRHNIEPCRCVDHLIGPDYTTYFSTLLSRSRAPDETALKAHLEGEPDRAPPVAVRSEAQEGLRFDGLAPGRYDLWFDLAGLVPLEVRGVQLVEGQNELSLECDRGATLLVTAPDRIPIVVSAQAIGEPRYVRTGAHEVQGLGAGRFLVTVWDRFTGLLLYSGEVASAGRGEIALPIEIE